jgi:hypothetical protein
VVTVNRRVTGVLSSLEVPVDGEVCVTPVDLNRGPVPLATSRSDIVAPTMTSENIAQVAIFVHQLLQIEASRSRSDAGPPRLRTATAGEPDRTRARSHVITSELFASSLARRNS